MVETALHSFLRSMPQAVAIWLIMVATALVAVVALSMPGKRQPTDDPAHGGGVLRQRRRRRAQAAAERAATRHYAEEVAVAAERATATAHQARAAWHCAHERVDHTWRTFDAADRAARRAAQAVAYPLTVDELMEVLARHSYQEPGFPSPRQEAFLRQVERARLFQAYREAQYIEQRAWHAADVASAAMRSLREEAAAAALQAGTVRRSAEPSWWAQQWMPTPEFAPVAAVLAATDIIGPAFESGGPVASDSDSMRPVPVPAQPRLARSAAPHPVQARSATPIRLPTVTGATPSAPLTSVR